MSGNKERFCNICGRLFEWNAFPYCDSCAQKYDSILNTLVDPDDLAKWYKEFEEQLNKMSTMEICNQPHDCNQYVAQKLNERIIAALKITQKKR